jgi:hypothetical protein
MAKLQMIACCRTFHEKFIDIIIIIIIIIIMLLPLWSEFLARDPEDPGSIRGANRFSAK